MNPNDYCPECGKSYVEHDDNACWFRYLWETSKWMPLEDPNFTDEDCSPAGPVS